MALLERRRRLLTEHIDTLREVFRTVREKHPFEIDAIVILPDHLHCIWTLPPDTTNYSMRWHLIKSAFSRNIEPGERLSKRRQKKGERGIWQRRFWEHVIRDEQDFKNHVDYIHYNPVKHGWAQQVIDWPYSSFHRYVRHKILPTNWAASMNIRNLGIE